jgi:rhodanese-related sulfurtransferase
LGLLSLFVATAAIAETIIPEQKRTVLAKYVSAKEAHDVVTARGGKVLFLDVRTLPELMFVGSTGEIDKQVPFVDFAHPAAWDDKNNRPQLVPNPSFVKDAEAALAAKGLDKTAEVLVMCRSGDRSARAVNALAGAGFTNVWSVYDGFEGDASSEGRRTVNGWKNANLPWSYKLDKAKITAAVATAP